MIIKSNYKTQLISILITFILLLNSLYVSGQIFDASQNPLSVKWRQLDAAGFKIIYPIELENEAQRLGNTFIKIYPAVGTDYHLRKTTIPVVLQNRGTTANGFVQLAPKKTQFYTTPPQQFDSQDWLNNLAVHELRHVAQFDKLTGAKSHLFFEDIQFAYIGLTTPTWFLEGDAVVTETMLTDAGRGRQPSWIMPFRTALLEGKKFSYSKAYFGSEKDLTPGYYQLGYLLTARLKNEYGDQVVNQILESIRKNPLRPYPFSRSLKKLTGYNTRQWYLHTTAQIKKAWEKQDSLNQSIAYQPLNQPATFATHYFLPQATGNEAVICLKQSKATPPALVKLNTSTGKEEKLFTIGYQEQPWFSYAQQKLVWDETRFDPRYKQRSYNVVCIYDMETGGKKQLTFKSRIFSPSLSADGQTIIAVQIDLSNQTNLIEIDPATGNTRHTYPNPERLLLQQPALNSDGTAMTWISVSEQGKALWLLKKGGEPQKIINETNQQLGRPVFNGDNIVFNAHLSGIDNLYEVNPHNKQISALSASKYGAFNASLISGEKTILFNDYGVTGYNVVKAPLEPRPVPEGHFVYFIDSLKHTSGNVFKNIATETFQSKPYRPLAHLFNFHSLSPFLDDNDDPGLQLTSTDLLSTFDFYGGVKYNSSLRKAEYQGGFAFKALYPILSAGYKNRPVTAFYKLNNTIHQAGWRENYLNAKIGLPLSVTSFNHSYVFLGEVSTSYTRRNLTDFDAKSIRSTIPFPMSYTFGFTHVIRAAERDINPRFAQTFNLKYAHRPFDHVVNGKLFAFQSGFYFPGVAANHTFSMGFNYQQANGVFLAHTEIPTVYGYVQIKARSLLHNTLLFNYRFPLAFPDVEIGPLAYIRNIRGGLFSHYENIGKETNLFQPKTFGFELRSSMNLLRYQPIADLGARMIFVDKTYKQNPIFELIFNYSF